MPKMKSKGEDPVRRRKRRSPEEKISDLEDAGNTEMDEVAIHAAAIRNAFFDDRKRMEDVIPPVLLVTVKDRKEIPPRRQAHVAHEKPSKPTMVKGGKASASDESGSGDKN